MLHPLFIDYFAERPQKGAVSTVFNTHVFVIRAWVVGHHKYFTQYIVCILAETPIQCKRSKTFTKSCENPDTGHSTRRLTVCVHKFPGLIPPQQYFANDATQPTATSILAQLILQLYCIHMKFKYYRGNDFLHFCDTRLLRTRRELIIIFQRHPTLV